MQSQPPWRSGGGGGTAALGRRLGERGQRGAAQGGHAARSCAAPIIFITGYGDVPMTVQAMKAGAVEFLTRPFSDDALLSAMRQAIERSRAALGHEAEMRALRDRYVSLTRREREVMALVVSGRLNKQVMRKMKAGSLPDLVNMAAKLDLGSNTIVQ